MYSIVDIELWISSAYWHVDVHVSGYVLVWCGQSCRGDFAAHQCRYCWQVMVDIWHYGDARWCKVVPLGPPHAMYGLHWACCPLALAAPAPTLAEAGVAGWP